MIHVTFNGAVCASLKKMCPKNLNSDNIIMLFLPLEVGNIQQPENSETNKVLYDILAGNGAYLKFKAEVERNCRKVFRYLENEEICFWIDFNDVKQHLNFSYFVGLFDRFDKKFYVEYDFNLYCENPDQIYAFENKKKPLSDNLILFLESELIKVQKDRNFMFRAISNHEIISVKEDYFDKYILPFLDEKPKNCMQIISEIFLKFGRLAVSFDQVVIRLWLLLREGVIERVGAKTENNMFFEYDYKLSDHIDMQRDS